MKKRLLSVLMVLCMVLTLLPVSAFAAGYHEDTPVTGTTSNVETAYENFYPISDQLNVVSDGWAQTGQGSVSLSDEQTTGTDVVWTHYYGSHYCGAPKGYTWIIVKSSNSNVATATAKQVTVDGKVCLQVDFQKGTASGTTQITVEFTVTELDVHAGIAQDSDTAYAVSGRLVYNVTNGSGGSETPDPNKPEKPTISDVPQSTAGGNVLVKCVTYPNTRPDLAVGDKTHAGYVSLRNSTSGWSFGEVTANDGSDSAAPIEDYPWMCKLIVNSAWYLDVYNRNYADTTGTHYLADPDQEVSARFFSDGYDWYYEEADMPLTVWTTHTAPDPGEDEDPSIDNFTKTRLIRLPQGVDLDLEGVTVNYDNPVVIPNGGSVTLLYALTVTGDAGANFTITDEGATLVGSDCDAQQASAGAAITGTIPEDAATATIYVIKTFEDVQDGATLTNTATIAPGEGTDLGETIDPDGDDKYETSDEGTGTSEEPAPPTRDPMDDITVTKEAVIPGGKETAEVGDTLEYTITITNSGDEAATVTVKDIMWGKSGDTVLVNNTPPYVDVSSGSCTVTVAAGDNVTIYYTYRVQESDVENGVSNKVTVSMPGVSDTTKTDTENVPVEAPTSGYVIHATTGANGSMTAGDVTIDKDHPADVPIADGGRVTFAIAPAVGYAVKSITIGFEGNNPYTYTNDGNTDPPGYGNTWNSYTMPDMDCNQSIHVEFGADTNGDGISDDLEETILVFAMYDGDFDAAWPESKSVAEFLVPTGTNLYEYMEASFTPAAVEGYTADTKNWYNWDNFASRFPENKTVDGWTNVIFNYEPNQYTLTYYGNGGATAGGVERSTSTVTYGREATLKNSSTFTREGYTFLGWSTAPEGTASDLYVPSRKLAVTNENFPKLTDNNGFALYAVWEKDAPQAPEAPTVADLDRLFQYLAEVDCITKGVNHPNKDFEDLIAGTYTIGDPTFENGQWTSAVTVESEKYVEAYNAEISGYTHTANNATRSVTLVWDDGQWTKTGNNNVMVVFDVQCTKNPTEPDPQPETYTVTFNPNNDVASWTEQVEDGETVEKPADPTREGYTFDGWYLNDEKYDFNTPVRGNITLVAKWTENEPVNPDPETYIINATSGPNGTVKPYGVTKVNEGDNLTISIYPNWCYAVDTITVDGIHYVNNGHGMLGGWDKFTFASVNANHDLRATFDKDCNGNGIPDKYEDHDWPDWPDWPDRPEWPDDPDDGDDDDRDDASDPTYAVYYYPGYGSGARDLDKRYEEDMEVEVLAFEDVDLTGREGYTFIGWSTQPNAGSVTYLPGDTFDMPDHDVYLYAQWLRDQIGPEDTGVANWLNTTDHIAYLTGYPNGAFGPNNSMTRAEVAQMFYALLNNKNVTITATFPDVPADAWYATAVNTLASLGMVSGDADGNFRPNDPITRAEFCVIALAFAYEPESYSCSFTDVSVNDWFYTYVAQAASYGWIGGYADGSFGPNDLITRAQVTTIVNNMLGREADRSYVNNHADTLVQFNDLTSIHWAYYDIMEAVNEHEYTKTYGVEDWVE